MKRIVAVVICMALAAALNPSMAQARRGGADLGAVFGAFGALLEAGAAAIEEAEQQQQQQGVAPGVRRVRVQCNMCGGVFNWQGEGNPPSPPCGCPSSYKLVN